MKRRAVEDPPRPSRGAVVVMDDTIEGISYNLPSNVALLASNGGITSSNEASNEASSSNDEGDSSEGQGEQHSQAASDVAVVVPRKKGVASNGGGSSSSSSQQRHHQERQQHQHQQRELTSSNLQGQIAFPIPKNFAERLMNILDSGVISDCIWWATDGKAVALHPKKLRRGNVLQEHFASNSYSGFLRNFNRWGFRRVPYSTVSDGAVTYKNSLFQRDQPFLVKHMRMDSDVQDVFERHQHHSSSSGSGSNSNSGNNSGGTRSSNAPPMASVGPTVAFGPSVGRSGSGSGTSQSQQSQSSQPRITTPSGLQQLIASLQNQGNTTSPTTNGGNGQQGPTAKDLGMLQVLQNAINPSTTSQSSNGGQQPPQGETISRNSSSISGGSSSQQSDVIRQLQTLLVNRQQEQQQQQQQQQDQQQQLQAALQGLTNNMNGGAQQQQHQSYQQQSSAGTGGGLQSAINTLMQQLQQGNGNSQQSMNNNTPSLPSPEVVRQNLLRSILELAQKYTQQPQPDGTRPLAIVTCIRLLKVLVMQELNQEGSGGESSPTSNASSSSCS